MKKQPEQSYVEWEYLSVRLDLAMNGSDLERLGPKGWELVYVSPIPYDPTQGMFYFKRKK